MHCPECGDKNVKHEEGTRRHICRSCGCVWNDDDFSPPDILEHGSFFLAQMNPGKNPFNPSDWD